MGQHKFNKTAIAAKEGKLPPKEKHMSRREQRQLLDKKIKEIVYKPLINILEKYIY